MTDGVRRTCTVALLLALLAAGPLGCHPAAPQGSESDLVVAGEVLQMGGRSCPLASNGCAVMLAKLPPGKLKLTASGQDIFGVLTPVLARAAAESRPVVITDLQSAEEVLPTNTPQMAAWSTLDPDAPGLRLRIIVRADGIWLGARSGKVLGEDARGPTVVTTEKGQDLEGLERKLTGIKKGLIDVEDECAVLPSLDTPISTVLQVVQVARKDFPRVRLTVP